VFPNASVDNGRERPIDDATRTAVDGRITAEKQALNELLTALH
jgi:hypothetical protein